MHKDTDHELDAALRQKLNFKKKLRENRRQASRQRCGNSIQQVERIRM